MKKRLIKVLYAWLTLIMALLIALTGTFVPQFMLDAKADRLASKKKTDIWTEKTKKTEKTIENLCLYTDATLSWRWSGSKCNVTYRYMGEWSE